MRLHLHLPIFAFNAPASAGHPGAGRWQLRQPRADRPPAAGPRSGAHLGLAYQPGLDGLRALSIIAVLLYHGGVSWAGGGFLGVESFFVLSGFLITSLLIAEWCESSRIRLGAFWARRARRLLPALFALVAVIGVYYTIAGPLNAVPGLRSDGIAALLYVGNWHQIATGSSYFVASGPVSPPQHTWSLAIEEQFYLLWPLILVAVFWLIGRRSASTRRSLTTLLGATIVAALASACETAVLYRGGTGLGRVYYGTDTRATGLLVGASLAIAIARARQAARRSPTGRRQRAGGAAALLAHQSSTGCSGAALLLVRLAVTFAVAVVSFVAIEQPVRRRRVSSWVLRPLVPAAVAGSLAALTAAAAVGAETPGGKLAAVPASVARQFVGNDRQCSVSLPDTAQYRAVPLPQSALGGYIFHWILKGAVDWNGGAYPRSGRMRYRTCPPKRVLMIGDSIAFTAGVPMLDNENRYGVELANAAILGCAFGNRGQLDVNGSYKALPAQCPDDLGRWERAARAFQAQVVVVELGYRDEFNWDWNGRAVHLGQRTFDAYVQQRIDRFAQVLSNGGAQVLFLTVPFVSPPALANGSPAPAGAPARHTLINSMLESAASQDPSRVAVLNVDSVVSPGNHYDETVNGQGCRFDGIHFSIYCASLLQPVVLGRARELIDR